MTKLTRFLANCLLVVSLSTVALADGGDTQGPPKALAQPPSAECITGGSGTEPSPAPQNSSIDIVTEVTAMLVTWLADAIL